MASPYRSSKKPKPKATSKPPKVINAEQNLNAKMSGYERERRHPSGSEWNRKKANVISYHSGLCCLCDHPGSAQVDHIVAYAEGGDDSLANLRPVHGSSGSQKNPCPVCGLNCNQVRAGLSFEAGRAKIARRIEQRGLTPEVKDIDEGREW